MKIIWMRKNNLTVSSITPLLKQLCLDDSDKPTSKSIFGILYRDSKSFYYNFVVAIHDTFSFMNQLTLSPFLQSRCVY